MATRTMDPGKLVMAFKGVNIVGPMDGTFLEVDREEDTFTKHVGANGDVTRVRNRNQTGSVTFTLIQASITNDQLSAILASDELSGNGVGVLSIKDLNGTTVYFSDEAWIRKPAKGEHAKDATGRQWIIDCAKLKMNIGGLLV